MDSADGHEGEARSLGTLVHDDDGTGAPPAAELPPIHRVSDGSEVSGPDSRRAWADAARPILEGVAGTYNATILDATLAEQVQVDSGVVSRQLSRYWIAKVMGLVAADCAGRDEPMLSALCIRTDGSTGGGYADAVTKARGEAPEDAEVHAAAERLACYQRMGAAMPNGGGRPTLTPEVAARRHRARSARGEPEFARTTCPTCFMVLPHTGQCDECE
ncbi:hypothetical protein PO878_09370 [Iamia majanohamensis]|uniref:Uncharacterized protein n=1 Tax=Iamia majanohamensis TaxID=467976 RepID=A0AAF0BVK0_9ACTN|nr:hypothetical protein [Iamia majanohamensis]WCO68932.1 hypothetical protein PO878_09370 [Iamia majanohamensis]